MVDASEILKDPAYINANEATKRAIFDKHIASDPAYAQANEPTRLAIESKFGLTPSTPSKDKSFLEVLETIQAAGKRPFEQVAQTVKGFGADILDATTGSKRRQNVDAEREASTRAYEKQYGSDALANAVNFYSSAGLGTAAATGLGRVVGAFGQAVPAVAKYVAPLAESIASGGFKTGLPKTVAEATQLGTTVAPRALDVALRGGGGLAAGGISSGIINPEDAGMGAAIGLAVPTAGAAIVGKIAQSLGWGKDLITGKLPEIKAAAIARAALGDKLSDALIALEAAPKGLTPAQVLERAGINADPFMALEAFAKKNDTQSWYRLLSERQTGGMANTLNTMMGGANQTAARRSAEESINALNASVVPQGQAALERANIGGTVTKGVQPEVNSAVNRGNKPTFDNAPSAATAQTQLDMLAAAGLKPIDTSAIVGSIQSKLTNPKIGPSDINSSVLGKVATKIKEWTELGGGVIDAEALYTIRKNAVNEEVQRLMGAATPTAQAKYAAKLLGEVNPLIDDAIEAAGGKGWKQYLETYATGRQKVEQKQMAAQIKNMFDNPNSKQQVIDLIRGKNPDAVEAVFGPGNYDIFLEMADKMPQLNRIARRLEGDIKIGEQAAAGKGGLQLKIKENENWFKRIPAFFSRATTAANMALDVLEKRVGEKTFKVFEEGFRNGKNVAELLNTLPTSERNSVLRVLKNSREWDSAVTSGAVQMLTPKNNLAPETRNNLRP